VPANHDHHRRKVMMRRRARGSKKGPKDTEKSAQKRKNSLDPSWGRKEPTQKGGLGTEKKKKSEH